MAGRFGSRCKQVMGITQPQLEIVGACMLAERLGLGPLTAKEIEYLTGHTTSRLGDLVRHRWLAKAGTIGRFGNVQLYRATRFAWAETGAQHDVAHECDRCGGQPCTVEIQFPVRPGVWLPYCDSCHAEMTETSEEVNAHEMARFGGQYGLVEWLIRPLRVRADQLPSLTAGSEEARCTG